MAKYLSKPCVDIRIKTMQISRKQGEESGEWQTYAVIIGEAVDEDGNVLESIHKKVNVGPPGPADWDADGFEADLKAIANVVKARYNDVLAEYTQS
jgi:hypothetical protein